MRKVLLASVAVIGLGFAMPSLAADNESYIDQTGLNNMATVEQSGTGAYASVNSAGISNIVTQTQTGTGGRIVTIQNAGQSEDGHHEATAWQYNGGYIEQIQHGDGNTANAQQDSAAGSSIVQHQTPNARNSTATAAQDHVHNLNRIIQTQREGNGNTAIAYQGDTTDGYIQQLQEGSDNIANSRQANGTGMQAIVLQYGSRHEAITEQTGNNHYVRIAQSGGDENYAKVTQSAVGNTSYVTQIGSYNSATVTQR